jgi:putative ABC transport system permease protein
VGSFERVEGFVFRNFNIDSTLDGGGYRVRGGSITTGLLGALDEKPILGRDFNQADGADFGFETSLILSHELWQSRFGSDPAIVGKTVGLNGRQLTVVGVMREGFTFPFRQQLWLPYAPNPDRLPTDRFLMAVAVLKPGASLATAATELQGVTARLLAQYPDAMKDTSVRAFPFKDLLTGTTSRAWASILLLGAALLLAVACGNLASALVARALDRRKEFAIRSAMGASRRHLVAEVSAEALVIALSGGLVGYAISRAALPAFVSSFTEPLPYWLVLSSDSRAFGVSLLLGAFTALTLGLLTARRASAIDLTRDLKDGGRGGSPSKEVRRTQGILVAAQVAVSVTLFVLASLLVKSGERLLTADSGMREEGLLTFRAYISGDAYDTQPKRAAAVDRLIETLETRPEISVAAVLSAMPVDDSGDDVRIGLGSEKSAKEMAPATLVRASAGAFETLGRGFLAGSGFQKGDSGVNAATSAKAVLGLRLATRLFGGASQAVGRNLTVQTEDSTPTRYAASVVGVVPDVQWEEFGETTDYSANAIYVPQGLEVGRNISVLARARSAAGAAALAPLTPRLVSQAIPGASAYSVQTMTELRAFTSWEQRLFGRMMGAFGIGALVAAATGLYGLLGYFVATRRREIGVRLALGASPVEVARLVVSRAAWLAGTGTVAGVLVALLLARLASSILFGIDALDASAPLMGALALVILIVAASAVPAARASRVDPVEALRAE